MSSKPAIDSRHAETFEQSGIEEHLQLNYDVEREIPVQSEKKRDSPGILKAKSLKKKYDLGEHVVNALLGVDFEVKEGDFVALLDHDNRYGRAYRKGAISIGIIVHSDCLLAGHGPGVTTLMTCETPLIKPIKDAKANIADLLGIGTAAKK